MQDKEFDELFKIKLDQAEIKPPVQLWDKIQENLDGPKKRNAPVAYWVAAAVVTIIGAVALLSPNTEKLQLQRPLAVETPVEVLKEEPTAPAMPVKTASERKPAYQSTPLVIAPRVSEDELRESFVAMQPDPVTERHDVKKDKIIEIKPTEPAVATPDEVMMADAGISPEALAQATTAESDGERKGIRNAGDVINYVVGKVDKRERKIIEFRTDEDDNSSLVSLNIGIIKFNRRSDR
ncbi:hypothetical protein [Pedobacter deserti]|uniref:hypothetical protein n=1 Tax=Pedobacter deserti TaxID=2817382 RepID=UPI00210DFE5D|nr:hypothetical protein [Pedobacter sp. SYSU D00382]